MSAYTYTDPDGDILAFRADEHVERLIVVADGAMAVYIPNADVPTVAAELLKAAGQEATILPKTIAEVQEFANGQLICGWVTLSAEKTPTWMREVAANYIALAEYIESKAQRETEAATKLQERRDAIAAKLDQDGRGYTYATISFPAQNIIDRLIELEDKRAA